MGGSREVLVSPRSSGWRGGGHAADSDSDKNEEARKMMKLTLLGVGGSFGVLGSAASLSVHEDFG